MVVDDVDVLIKDKVGVSLTCPPPTITTYG